MIALRRIRLPAGCAARELWKRRARTRETIAGVEQVWESRCGQFRVVCSRIKYGHLGPRGSYPPRWHALYLAGEVSSLAKERRQVWSPLPGSPFRAPGPAFREAEAAMTRDVKPGCRAESGKGGK